MSNWYQQKTDEVLKQFGADLALAIFFGFLVPVGIQIEKWPGWRGDRSQTVPQKGAARG